MHSWQRRSEKDSGRDWEEKDDARIAERSVAIRKSKAIRPLYEIDPADLVHPVKEWRCPTCDSFYGEPLMKWSYCPCCGQHIDWADETINTEMEKRAWKKNAVITAYMSTPVTGARQEKN